MSGLRKPLLSPFLPSCPQQAAQTREALGCPALLSLSKRLTISILSSATGNRAASWPRKCPQADDNRTEGLHKQK